MEALTLWQLAELETRLRDADSRSNVHIPSNYTETIWALVAMARSSLADREDAQRYRWLRDDSRGRALSVSALSWAVDPSEADKAVDAARAQPPKD